MRCREDRFVKDVHAADAVELIALQVEREPATADALGLILDRKHGLAADRD
jgi:hypothetical protein